jgi:ABC-type multidrug transport system permease subunit
MPLTSKLGNDMILTIKLGKGAVKMKKEDILMKSQMENHDEGEENAENQGRALGVIAMAVIFIFITVFSIIFNRGNSTASSAASAMFWAFLSSYYIPQYRFAKKKSILIISIGFAIASITSLLSFIIMVIK